MQSQSVLNWFTQNIFENQLVQIILNLNMFFCFVEHLFFLQLLKLFHSDVDISHWIKFSCLVKKWVKKLKKTVLAKLELKTKVLLTLNCWTSLNNLAFLDITEYFIDESWDYWEVLLEFQPLHSQHTEKNLIKVIVNVMNSYSVLNRLLIMTADNTFNNVTLYTELTTLLWKWKIK